MAMTVSTAKTASRIRLIIASVVGKFAVRGQEIEYVFELLFIVSSFDFFVLDGLAECESGQAGMQNKRGNGF